MSNRKGFNHYLLSEAADAALLERAEKFNVPVEVLREVFDRGVVAWDEDTGKTPSQYAFNRVDSFLNGGYAAKLDEDLLNELSPQKMHNYIRMSKHVVDNMPTNSKEYKKSKTGIERAERLLSKKTIKEEKTRHPTEKKAYVEPYRQDGETNYKASDKHGKLKFFNKHGREAAYKHAGLKVGVRKLKTESNVIDISGTELIERKVLARDDPAQYATVNRRETKSSKVRQRHTEKEKDTHDQHRSEVVLRVGFQKRNKKDHHLVDKKGHQLTDRIRDQNRQRLSQLRKAKNVHEGAEYIEARRKLHDAHHESARLHAGMERDPELRRQDMHRAKRHKHASRVLEIIAAKRKKKDK